MTEWHYFNDGVRRWSYMFVTKTVLIGRSGWLEYIANPETMPQWAIHNMNSIRKLERGRWEMEIPRGGYFRHVSSAVSFR